MFVFYDDLGKLDDTKGQDTLACSVNLTCKIATLVWQF
jgi:hypothetical protein